MNKAIVVRVAFMTVLLGSATPSFAAPTVEEAVYGTAQKGETAHAFTLRNDHGMSAKILDFGGTIAEIDVPGRDGKLHDVVLSMPDLKGWESQTATINSIVGRYSNKLKHGFTIDGTHVALPEDAQGTTLHGGQPSYGARVFGSKTFTKPDSAGVTLHLTSPDGDQGFPGTLMLDVTFSITNDNSLRLDYRATTDKPTVINFTNHTYFNMAGDGSVENQLLQVMADSYTPTTADAIPTGEIVPVAGTAMDFRQPTAIGAHLRSTEPQMIISQGYNINMIVRHAKPGALDLAARLIDPASGTVLELSTTEPGIQLYSANGLNGKLVSAAGATIRQTDAMALETEHWPDSPNHPGFPSTELRPGQIYTSTTLMHFTVQ